MAGGGYALGLTGLLTGAYLIDCAVQGRPPVGTLKDLIQNPTDIRGTLDARKTALKVVPAYSSAVASSATANSQAQAAVAFARSQIGKPYRWGARGPNAYDCSGLTQAAYKSIGVSIAPTSATQLFNGRSVSREELLPGDLVFPHAPAPTGHVQIYSGGGNVIEAPKTGLNVREVPMWGFWRARRILESSTGVDFHVGTANTAPSIRSVTGSAG